MGFATLEKTQDRKGEELSVSTALTLSRITLSGITAVVCGNEGT